MLLSVKLRARKMGQVYCAKDVKCRMGGNNTDPGSLVAGNTETKMSTVLGATVQCDRASVLVMKVLPREALVVREGLMEGMEQEEAQVKFRREQQQDRSGRGLEGWEGCGRVMSELANQRGQKKEECKVN